MTTLAGSDESAAAAAAPPAAVGTVTGRRDDGFGTGLLVTGCVLLGIVVVLALLAPLITSSGPREITMDGPLRPPGGAHLLGVKGPVVIAHGASSRVAIANALSTASDAAAQDLPGRMAARLTA